MVFNELRQENLHHLRWFHPGSLISPTCMAYAIIRFEHIPAAPVPQTWVGASQSERMARMDRRIIPETCPSTSPERREGNDGDVLRFFLSPEPPWPPTSPFEILRPSSTPEPPWPPTSPFEGDIQPPNAYAFRESVSQRHHQHTQESASAGSTVDPRLTQGSERYNRETTFITGHPGALAPRSRPSLPPETDALVTGQASRCFTSRFFSSCPLSPPAAVYL